MGLLHQALLHLALQSTTNVITTTDFVQRQSQRSKRKKYVFGGNGGGEGEGAGWWERGGGWGLHFARKTPRQQKS